MPVGKGVGDKVIGSTINQQGMIYIKYVEIFLFNPLEQQK